MKPSTRELLRLHRWRLDRSLHHYLYFRYYAPYTKLCLHGVRWLTRHAGSLGITSDAARFVFDRYHSKVLSGSNARKILALDVDLRGSRAQGKRIVPFRYAHDIIFHEPDFIVVMDCPCKAARPAPHAPVNACIAVGRRVGSFWLEHCQKYHPRRIEPDEALEIVAACRKSGHVTQAFFKVATGGSTGVICNCHPDDCVSLEASRLSRRLPGAPTMNAPSGYSVAHQQPACTLCGSCAAICPFEAITVNAGEHRYDPQACMGCELCVEHCPEGALSLRRDPAQPEPLDVAQLQRPPSAPARPDDRWPS